MDEPHFHQPVSPLAIARDRLVAQAGLLLVALGVFAALLLLGAIDIVPAIAGFVALAVAIAMLPSDHVTITRVEVPRVEAVNDDGGIFAFADALADPCLVLDRRTVVQHANAPALSQFPAVANGNPITFSLRNPLLVDAIDHVMRSGLMRSFELHETLPSETWDKVIVSPLRRPGQDWLDDDQRQLVITFQSLTELKRVDALRSDFIANASHELRTPLASLLGFIDTLLGPAARDAAAREKFLGIMRGQAERMSKLIDDLLRLSRI